MPRRFATFPGGTPGVGLLLLRAVAALALAAKGLAWLATAGSAVYWLLAASSVACGAALMVGALTPAVGVATACVALGGLLTGADGGSRALSPLPADVFLAVVGAALTLLGPGAFSLDARLFGRREIVVPRGGARPVRSGPARW